MYCLFLSLCKVLCRVDRVGGTTEHTNTHVAVDEREFQYKRRSNLCGAPPHSIHAKVLGPQLGNMCQLTLGGPVDNSLSQEQVVAT